MKYWKIHFVAALVAVSCQGPAEQAKNDSQTQAIRTNNDNIRENRTPLPFGPDSLSAYGLFEGKLSHLTPAAGVHPYDLNMPLFSDYANKSRFISLPENTTVSVSADGSLDFPEGTLLIKTFHYPAENPAGRKLLETRIIKKGSGEWKALIYIWNDEQTEAFLEVAGGNMDVEWKEAGVLKKVNYSVPDVNQCKTCHGRSGAIVPLGPKLSQLNKDFAYPDGATANQLTYWQQNGLLSRNVSAGTLPSFPEWGSAAITANIDQAARAYLDSNCGSCHHPEGSANTSGLYLTFNVTDGSKYGIMKKPVAAGKGSGGRLYGIVPGKPDESILLFRMESTDPGVMMPELGRSVAHQEGIALIKRWIEEMEAPAGSM